MNKNFALSLFGGALLIAGPALLTSPNASAVQGSQTIFDIVETTDDFSTLETALLAAGLDGTLDGTERFTVFAPTNAAFALLGTDTINALLNDVPTLDKILKYHVLAGDVDSTQVMNSTFLTTLVDQRLDVSMQGMDLFVDGVRIATANVPASNGIVHIIDAVLQPNTRTILGTAADVGGFETLDTAVDAAMLTMVLESDGPFTVFAPNDPAFDLLPPAGLASLVTNQIPLLTLVLQYHVVDGRVYSDQVAQLSEVTTLLGARLKVRVVNDEIFINNSRVILPDVEAVNGNIHVIDKVLGGERVF